MNNSLTRIPQDLNTDVTALERTFGSQGLLIRDLLIFLSSRKMKNLFGEIEFSMQEFCTTMGYKRTHLQTKLTEEQKIEIFGKTHPILETNLGGGKIHVHEIETVFEAALWQAMKEKIAFQRHDKGKGITYFNSVEILKGFTISYEKNSNKKSKRLYGVSLSHEITDFLLKSYNLIELSEYAQLPKISGYKNFYLLLSRLIVLKQLEQKNQKSIVKPVSVEQLAKLFHISTESNKDRKKNIKTILTSIKNKLVKTKFDFEFVKNNTKFAYFIDFKFPDETLAYFNEKKVAVFFAQLYSACELMFLSDKFGAEYAKKQEFERKRYNNQVIPDQLKEEFLTWLNSEEDREKKESIYKKIFNENLGEDFIL